MINVKDEFVVKQSTNINKKWEKDKRVSKAEKIGLIHQYREVLELISLFGGFITKEHLHKLMKYDKTEKGIEYILKRLYKKGILNTYTILLNKDNQIEMKHKEFIVFAFSKVTSLEISKIDKTVSKPSKFAILKQMYDVSYFASKYDSAITTTFRNHYQKLSEDKQNEYIYTIYIQKLITDILKMEVAKQEKMLVHFGYYDVLTNKSKDDKKILKEHFDINAYILHKSDEFQEYKSSFTEFAEIDFSMNTTVLDFIRKYQYNNTIISYEAFNEYAASELKKEGYAHMLKKERLNREYQNGKLSIGRKIYNVQRQKKKGWKEECDILKTQLNELEKRARFKILKKSLKWNEDNKQYDVYQREEIDSLLRLKDLNSSITSFRIKDKKVYITVDIYDVYYKIMSSREIVDRIINIKYLFEALFSFYDDKSVKESDMLIKFTIKSFRDTKDKTKNKVESLLRSPEILMHDLVDNNRIQYMKI